MVLSSRSEKNPNNNKTKKRGFFYIWGGVFLFYFIFFFTCTKWSGKCLLYEINILIFNSTSNILQHYYNMNDSTPCHLI